MPQAVTHVLVTILLLSIFRHYVIRNKQQFPLFYVFIGGVAGLLPDIDIALQWIFNEILGFSILIQHRPFTHILLFPLFFFFIALIFYKWDKKAATIFGLIAFGCTIHLILDLVLTGGVNIFYPFFNFPLTKGLLSWFEWKALYPGIDAILLLAWLFHESRTHKIKDFI